MNPATRGSKTRWMQSVSAYTRSGPAFKGVSLQTGTEMDCENVAFQLKPTSSLRDLIKMILTNTRYVRSNPNLVILALSARQLHPSAQHNEDFDCWLGAGKDADLGARHNDWVVGRRGRAVLILVMEVQRWLLQEVRLASMHDTDVSFA